MSQDLVRDVEMGAARLTAAAPRMRVFATPDGRYVAALVVAESSAEATEALAAAKLAEHVSGMLDANIDHDRIFQDRLKAHASSVE